MDDTDHVYTEPQSITVDDFYAFDDIDVVLMDDKYVQYVSINILALIWIIIVSMNWNILFVYL